MKLALNSFIGEAPRIASRLLPQQAAQKAEEVKFLSGELRPFFEDTLVLNLDNNINYVYKWYISSDKAAWIISDVEINIEKSPVFNDENSRIIINYPETKETRITDSVLADLSLDADGNYLPLTLTKSNTYNLKVPKITNATMAVNGTSSTNVESRSYAVALVREWYDGKLDVGPLYSPVTTSNGNITVDVGTGQTVTLSDITVPSDAYTDCGVRKAYVYRSTVGSDGTAMYGFVGEFAITDGTTVYSFTDSRSAEDVEEAAVSSEWDEPLEMSGVISLSNGVFVGFNGYDIYFSYPYQIHAWPYTYRVTVDHEIVGLGAFGNTVVVCTKGAPYLLLVSDPAAVTVRPINSQYPCLSKKSIITLSNGVVYASVNGLVLVNSTSPTYFTDKLLTKDEWRNFYPSKLSAAYYLDSYVGVSNDKDEYIGLMINVSDPSTGLTTIRRNIISLYSDPNDNLLYFIVEEHGRRKLILFDSVTKGSDQNFRSFTWRSKVFTSTAGDITLAACRVRADYASLLSNVYYDYTADSRPINSAPIHTSTINSPVNLSYYFDVINRHNAVLFNFIVNNESKLVKLVYAPTPFRLPSGFRGDEIEVEVTSRIPVHSIELASSMGELL